MADNNGKKVTSEQTRQAAVSKVKENDADNRSARVLTADTLPTADALKKRFKAGSIPLQTDFADLIDIANIGRTAIGENGSGFGFSRDTQGRIQTDSRFELNFSYDLSYAESTVWTDYRPAITLGADYLGTDVNHNNIALLAQNKKIGPVKAIVNSGSEITTYQLPAMVTDSSGKKTMQTIDIIGRKNIGVQNNAIPLQQVDNSTSSSLDLTCNFQLVVNDDTYRNKNLTIAPLTLEIRHVPDQAHDAYGDLVGLLHIYFYFSSAQQLIPQGLISMFSGSKAPAGWAICDGSNGTPDLRDRFIVGKGSKFTHEGEGTTTTDTATVAGSVTVQGTALTEAQIPQHKHSMTLNSFLYTYVPVSTQTKVLKVMREGKDLSGESAQENTDSTGTGTSHTHSASLTTQPHSHTVSPIPPYYALAFIMKL